MACIQTLKGIAADCLNTIGGIVKVWLANDEEVAAPTAAESGNAYTLASSDMAKFKEYAVDRNSSALTSTFTRTDNGGGYFTHELALQFRMMDADKHAEINTLSAARLAVVVLDKNGKYFCFKDAEMNGGTAQTGTNPDDLNGYNPTISGESAELPWALASFTPSVE